MILLISGEVGIAIATGNYRGTPFHPAFLLAFVAWGNGRAGVNDNHS